MEYIGKRFDRKENRKKSKKTKKSDPCECAVLLALFHPLVPFNAYFTVLLFFNNVLLNELQMADGVIGTS